MSVIFTLPLERGISHGSQMETWWQSSIAAYALCAVAYTAYALCVGTALLLMRHTGVQCSHHSDAVYAA